jgi:hypothetical protein
VGIGETSPDNLLHITSAGSDTTLIKLENTNADSLSARMTFVRTSANPAVDDDIGKIDFYANDNAGNSDRYALMRAKIKDTTNGSEDAQLIFSTVVDGSNVDTMYVTNARVGINETTPVRTLTVVPGQVLLHVDADGAGGEARVDFKVDSTNTDKRIKANIALVRDDPGTRGTGSLQIRVEGNNDDTNAAEGDTQFSIGANGRVVSQSNAGSWMQMNGTSNIDLNDSYNVSGISDNGTGSYDMTHAVDFSNDDYAVATSCNLAGGSISNVNSYVGTANVIAYNAAGSVADPSRISAIAFGDIPHE